MKVLGLITGILIVLQTIFYILLNLAICCQGIGKAEDAKNYVLKILYIDPNNTAAHKLLSTLTNYNDDQEHLEKMKKLTEQEIFKQFSSTQEVELLFLSVPSKQIPKVMAQSMSQQTRKFVLLIHCVVLCQKVGFDPFDLIPFDQVANGCG